MLLVPLTNLFNFCFCHGCCPPQWCHSYLLTLYKGKGSKSDPNSARGIVLQSRLINIYCYLLDQRLYHWAEAQSLIPREQQGFRSGKSTMSAIADLPAWVKDYLSNPSVLCTLYMSISPKHLTALADHASLPSLMICMSHIHKSSVAHFQTEHFPSNFAKPIFE